MEEFDQINLADDVGDLDPPPPSEPSNQNQVQQLVMQNAIAGPLKLHTTQAPSVSTTESSMADELREMGPSNKYHHQCCQWSRIWSQKVQALCQSQLR